MWALGAGVGAYLASGVVGLGIIGWAGAFLHGSALYVVSTAGITLPFALGVGVVVRMLRRYRKDVSATLRKRADERAAREKATEDARRATIEEARRGAIARADAERERLRQAEETRRRQTAEEIRESVSLAVTYFNDLPVRLERAASMRDEAQQHYTAGAYSPFWSAIEESLTQLARFRSRVDSVASCAARYSKSVENFKTQSGASALIPAWPQGLEVLSETTAAQSIAASISALTYEAQKNPVFAQIWEQRRTTAATIQGFANIEAAMRGMGSQIESSVKQLQSTVIGVGLGLAGEIRSARDSAEVQGRDGGGQLGTVAGELRSAVFYLREADARERGHYVVG